MGRQAMGLCFTSGILHVFDVNQGKATGLDGQETDGCGLGGNVVLQLTKTLPQKPFKIFADNFLTNFDMAAELKKRGLTRVLFLRIACTKHH